MKKNTTTTTTRFDHFLYSLSDEELRRKLKNHVVIYHNLSKSTVKADGVRQLVIKSIDYTGYAKGSGRRYIQGEVQDLDDGGAVKFRTLHVAGITKVKGKISTAINLAKSVF